MQHEFLTDEQVRRLLKKRRRKEFISWGIFLFMLAATISAAMLWYPHASVEILALFTMLTVVYIVNFTDFLRPCTPPELSVLTDKDEAHLHSLIQHNAALKHHFSNAKKNGRKMRYRDLNFVKRHLSQ